MPHYINDEKLRRQIVHDGRSFYCYKFERFTGAISKSSGKIVPTEKQKRSMVQSGDLLWNEKSGAYRWESKPRLGDIIEIQAEAPDHYIGLAFAGIEAKEIGDGLATPSKQSVKKKPP